MNWRAAPLLISFFVLAHCQSGADVVPGDARDDERSDLGASDAGDVSADLGGDLGTDVIAIPDSNDSDALGDGSPEAGVEWHDVADSTRWAFYDVSTVSPGARMFYGAAFDGHFLYLVPDNSGAPVARFDTTSPAGLASASSWTFFDVSTVNPAARAFGGAAFDGRYVYFEPYNSGTPNSVVARFDTTSASGFASAASWDFFDVSTLNAAARGFASAVFDGHYLYFVPYSGGTGTPSSFVARYDTSSGSGFASAASWTFFDLTTVNAGARGFIGAAFDGRYVYLVPDNNGSFDGLVARFDTSSASGFESATSWAVFDVSTVNPGARGFQGAAFDGRYLYLVPIYNGTFDGIVARFDTTSSSGFASPASWTVFDVRTLNPGAGGFLGAAFDGRFLYLVANYNGAPSGILARFDTTSAAGFASAASWTFFDMSTLNAGARGYYGAAFDGRFVYFVPNDTAGGGSGMVARFDARTPPAMPTLPGWFSWGPASFL
jgi:hypothetical protein